MYTNLDHVISYNALLNFIIGERGVGKTYSTTKFVISQFIKKKEEFAYIRRYKNELKTACPNFFSALNKNDEFNTDLYYNNGKFYCDDEICGHPITLSTSQDLKSVNFPNVKNIIFDEFIIEEGQKKYYLNNEVFVFLNLIETIARMRDVRVFLLGNACSLTNPYFLYFDLELPYNTEIKLFKNNTILLQYLQNPTYRKAKENTRFGQLIQNTSFADYAINNKFLGVNSNFIGKKDGTVKFSFAFIFENDTFGVWISNRTGKIYVSNDYQHDTPFMFSTTLENHTPNTLFIKSARKYRCWKFFIENYSLGNVYFENQKIKNITQKLIKSMLI